MPWEVRYGQVVGSAGLQFQVDTSLGSQPKGKPGNSKVEQGIPPCIFLLPFLVAQVAAKKMEQQYGGKGLRDAHVSCQFGICREERPQPASQACDRQQRQQGTSRPAPEQDIPPQGGMIRRVLLQFIVKPHLSRMRKRRGSQTLTGQSPVEGRKGASA